MPQMLLGPWMLFAVQSCLELQLIARRDRASVPLTEEEDFAVRMIYRALAEILADGTRAAVIPRVPFELGGVFHPENLELLINPNLTQMTSRFKAPAPAFKKGDSLLIPSDDGQELKHTVCCADWIPEEKCWLYSLGPGYDSKGNLQAIDCYLDAKDLERVGRLW